MLMLLGMICQPLEDVHVVVFPLDDGFLNNLYLLSSISHALLLKSAPDYCRAYCYILAFPSGLANWHDPA